MTRTLFIERLYEIIGDGITREQIKEIKKAVTAYDPVNIRLERALHDAIKLLEKLPKKENTCPHCGPSPLIMYASTGNGTLSQAQAVCSVCRNVVDGSFSLVSRKFEPSDIQDIIARC